MSNEYRRRHVTDEERRDLLKALGVAGAVATGSTTLQEMQSAVSSGTTEELAPIGQAIAADLEGRVDAGFVANQQAELAAATSGLPAVLERGVPEDGPHDEFAAVAEAGRPVYDHLTDVGFFESTTDRLPEFTPEFLTSTVEAFVGSEALANGLSDLDFSGTEGVDLLSTVVANAEELSRYHWVATDEIPRERIEFGEFVPPMTMGAAGGALLWLEDLDTYLWQKQVLLTDDIVETAVWHGQSMAAGFHLMAEGARVIGAEETLSEGELGALLSTGFAVQAIAQGLLPQDVYWITEETRAPRRTDVRPAEWSG